MCNKCDEIDATVARYKRLKGQILDQQLHQAIERLALKLETEKRMLHREQK